MAQPTSDDIKAYGDLLVKQGKDPNDVKAYTDHLHQLYDVQPQAAQSGFLDQHPAVKTAVQGAVNDLPMIGGIVGGAVGGGVGSVTVPGVGTALGGMSGAAAGGALGSTAKDMLNKAIFGKDTSGSDMLKNAGENAATMGMGEGLGTVAGVVGKAALTSKLAGKTADALFDISPKVIQTYATKGKQIMEAYKAADGNVAQMADDVKQGYQQSLDDTRKALNGRISSTLENSDATVSGDSIIKRLSDARDKINPKLYPEQSGQVQSMIDKVKSLADGDGNIDVSEAHELKQYLQEQATSFYRNNGQTSVGQKAAAAAAYGASEARTLVNKAVPEVAAANNKLSYLHSIEDTMNKSILKEGSSESGLIAAGKGTNERNMNALKKLGDATGTDMLGKAQELAAAKTFGDPSLKGSKFISGLAGGAAAVATHGDPAITATAAAAGNVVSSPAALKAGINAANMLAPGVAAAGKVPLGTSVLSGKGAINALSPQPGQEQGQ